MKEWQIPTIFEVICPFSGRPTTVRRWYDHLCADCGEVIEGSTNHPITVADSHPQA